MPPRPKKPTPVCPRCAARGKTWTGNSPKCAFPDTLAPASPVFSVDNWNCATMNALREIADEYAGGCFGDRHVVVGSAEQYGAILPFEEGLYGDWGFVVISWYKHRGQTEHAHALVRQDAEAIPLTVVPLTLEYAERAI